MSSRHSKKEHRVDSGFVEVKSKFEAEFRRFSVPKANCSSAKFDNFFSDLVKLHGLKEVPILISYTDPRDGDLLPINNDDNLQVALQSARPLLRIIIQRKGDGLEELNGYGVNFTKSRNIISTILSGATPGKPKHPAISNPHDFRQVSSIIDVHIVPKTHRRVRLVKHGSDRPLGFYIRDGTSFRVTSEGMHKVPGIFISRLVPGGLAESTGLLAVNDEVIEVNGIEVAGKTLDQVTDMMVANSWNLIITVIPSSSCEDFIHFGSHISSAASTLQRQTISDPLNAVRRGSEDRNSGGSGGSGIVEDEEDLDEVLDLTGVQSLEVEENSLVTVIHTGDVHNSSVDSREKQKNDVDCHATL